MITAYQNCSGDGFTAVNSHSVSQEETSSDPTPTPTPTPTPPPTQPPSLPPPLPPGSSVLAQMAASLAPGQSRKLPTVLNGHILVFGSELSNFIQWGSSGYYDPLRHEIGFIGKRDGPNQYHWLVYDEATNTWSNSRPVWDTGQYYGHGYDHNTIDPETGTVYFRIYNESKVRVWNGSWSETPAWTQNTTIVGGLSWFPKIGLIYNDGAHLLRLTSTGWESLAKFGGGSYQDMSEYNSTTNTLIFGSGNDSLLYKLTADLKVSEVAPPPFNVGSGSGQGVCISDPASAQLIAYEKRSTNWAKYDIINDKWTALSQVVGDGSVPDNGTPKFSSDPNHQAIGIPIPPYQVIMFVQYKGFEDTPAEVWLYKHSQK